MKKLILAVSVLALAACDKKEEPRLPTAEEQRVSDLCRDCCGIRSWVLAGSNHEEITTGTLGCFF